ncbi:hypothetical protein PCE1_003097 [Barthelona sp. PCE]
MSGAEVLKFTGLMDGTRLIRGKLEYAENGCIYEGEFDEQNKRSGFGSYIYGDGTKYEGEWQNDVQHGEGVMHFANGNVFKGIFVGGSMSEGELNLKNDNGSTDLYQGQFQNNKFHGNGKYAFNTENTVIYTGEWENGLRHGMGTVEYYNKEGELFEKYVGSWKQGRMEGKGIYHCSDKTVLEGTFQDNQIVQGKMVHGDGTKVFEGNFLNGMKHNGTLIKEGISRYIGEFKNDIAHGKGELLLLMTGDRIIGNFENGMKNGECQIVYHNKDVFTGTFVDDCAEGYGELMYANGSKYEGNWKMNKRHGHGVFYAADGTRYEGSYVNGRRHGQGKLFLPSGIMSCIFDDGKLKNIENFEFRSDSPWNDPSF